MELKGRKNGREESMLMEKRQNRIKKYTCVCVCVCVIVVVIIIICIHVNRLIIVIMVSLHYYSLHVPIASFLDVPIVDVAALVCTTSTMQCPPSNTVLLDR